jgi:hypothetical protein
VFVANICAYLYDISKLMAITSPDELSTSLEVSTKDFNRCLDALFLELDTSGEVDVIGLRNKFRQWNQENFQNFEEDDDVYLGLIDDFFKTCGKFESIIVLGQKKYQAGSEAMINSINSQKEVVELTNECCVLGDDGSLLITNSKKFDRLFGVMDFLTRATNNIRTLSGSGSQAKPYLSGIRSMVCANLLLKSVSDSVSFADPEHDRDEEVDFVVVKDDKMYAVDVTTGAMPFDHKHSVLWVRDNAASQLKTTTKDKLSIDHSSKLTLSRASTSREYYDQKYYALGIPSVLAVQDMRKVFY